MSIGDLSRLAAEVDGRIEAARRFGYCSIADLLAASVRPGPTGEIIPNLPTPAKPLERDRRDVPGSTEDGSRRRWIPL